VEFNLKQALRVAGGIHNLNNAEIASLCGMLPQQLSFLKGSKSNPSVKTLIKISKGLQVPLSEFILYGEKYGK
jgi:transcriptional regulator with XRE-family HTH domain